MLACRIAISTTELELPYGGGIERIPAETFAIGDRVQLLDASVRPVARPDGDRPIERDHEERARDLAGSKAAENVEDERDLGRLGQPRMATRHYFPSE